jgi:hypothetical protein
MANTKYIIVDNGCTEVPIVFPGYMSHSEMARFIALPIVSAGYCYITVGAGAAAPMYGVYGRVDNLGIVARPEDAEILDTYLLGE